MEKFSLTVYATYIECTLETNHGLEERMCSVHESGDKQEES